MAFHEVKNQILATIIVNILCFGSGSNVGWFSPTLPLLRTEETPLSGGPLTDDEIGWIGSLPSWGAILASILCAYISTFIGFRKTLLVLTGPLITSWLIIIFCDKSWMIFISRILLGISGGGAYLIIPQYVSEIADDYIRGQLNSYIQVSCYLGVLVGYIGGSYLDYYTNPLVMITIPIIFCGLFTFMPDTPQFLLKKNRIQDAEKSLRFYRNCTIKSGTKIQESKFQEEFIKFKAIAEQNEINPNLTFADFYHPDAIKAFIIGIVLLGVNQLSGSFILSTYAVTIFNETGSTFDPKLSAILMVILQVFGTYMASILMDKTGRKTLLIASNLGACTSMIITGVYVLLGKNGYDIQAYNLLPVISLSFFIFICAIGVLPVPYVILSEVMPQKIRKSGSFICTVISFILQSIILKLFPFLMNSFGLAVVLFGFASVTTFGTIFAFTMINETNGKNLDVLNEHEDNAVDDDDRNNKRRIQTISNSKL